MAEIKVEDYPNEAIVIADTDLIDLSVDSGGGAFESQLLTFATLRAVLLGFRRFKVSRAFGDFSFAGLERNIEIFSLPAGYEISKILMRHETAWAGPGIAEVEVELGIVTELDRYVFQPFDIFQAVGDKILSHNVINKVEDFVNVTSIRSNIRSVGANLDQLNAGDIDYYIYIEQFK